MIAARSRRLQDLWAQHRRHECGSFLTDRQLEECRNEVVIAKWKFALHERASEIELGTDTIENLGRMQASVDHLYVVDRDDRAAVQFGKKIYPRLEVADHHVG